MWGQDKERRLTHDEWGEWLLDPRQKLTLQEFIACELAGIHLLLARMHTGLGLTHLNENGTGGYFEQIRNLLDRFVGHVTTPRQTPPRPAVAAVDGPPSVRLLRPGEQSPQEGA